MGHFLKEDHRLNSFPHTAPGHRGMLTSHKRFTHQPCWVHSHGRKDKTSFIKRNSTGTSKTQNTITPHHDRVSPQHHGIKPAHRFEIILHGYVIRLAGRSPAHQHYAKNETEKKNSALSSDLRHQVKDVSLTLEGVPVDCYTVEDIVNDGTIIRCTWRIM